MKYYVNLKIETWATACVEADSIEEAERKAEQDYSENDVVYDWPDSDHSVDSIEDEDGNVLWSY